MLDQANRLRSMVATKEDSGGRARVITVTSGKGGVGKTNFALNLAIQLSKLGKRVVIVDADLGLANVEVLFGIIPKHSLADVMDGSRTIEQIITEGPMGIKFVSGGSGLSELVSITDEDRQAIFSNFEYLDQIADIVIVDTGAGISKTVLSFIRAAEETILVVTPEPTSITDAYALIKTTKTEYDDTLPDFKVVVNRADSDDEGNEIFHKLAKVSDKFLDVELEMLGHIPMDLYLIKAVKKQQPVSMCYPNSGFTRATETIALKLLQKYTDDGKQKLGIKSFIRKLTKIFNN